MVDDNLAHDAQEVAQMEADVGQRHIGTVYAEALLDAAEKVHAADALMDVFDAVVADVLNPFPKFEQLLASALIPHEEKVAILDRVFKSHVPAMFLNFLKVVSSHDRMDCLRAIHVEMRMLFDQRHGRVPVELVTPVAIDDAQTQRLSEQLHVMLGVEPVMSRRVDPDLIGGAVVRVGDTIYDGSVATQLQNLCQQIIDRSADEIQSRRDHFRNSARD